MTHTHSLLRFGMLSTANIGDELVPAFAQSDQVVLTAVASRDSDRARSYAARHGIESAYGSYEELLGRPDIDAVYIALPNSLHADWTERALTAGKHVLCEKPLTPSAQEASALFDLATARGLVLAEAFMYRHHEKALRTRELVAAGAIGEIRTVRAWFGFTVADPEVDIRYRPDLAGGALNDVGCYCVSFINLVIGETPDVVRGVATLSRSGVDESFHGLLSYPSGAVGSFDCSLATPLDLGVAVVGSEGVLSIEVPWYAHKPPHEILLRRGAGVESVPVSDENAYKLELDNFAAVVRGESAPTVGREETVLNRHLAELLRTAAGLTNDKEAI